MSIAELQDGILKEHFEIVFPLNSNKHIVIAEISKVSQFLQLVVFSTCKSPICYPYFFENVVKNRMKICLTP